MSKKTRRQKFEVYNHRILWSLAKKNLKDAREQDHSQISSLGAMISACFAIEGYLNWLGSRIDPEVWSSEKNFFSTPPYNGMSGKYRYLRKLLHLSEPDFSKAANQTFKLLEKLRNDAVHPKQERGTREVIFHKEYDPPYYGCNLAKQVSLSKAERAMKHCEELMDELHVKAREFFPDIVTESAALEGFLGFEITDY